MKKPAKISLGIIIKRVANRIAETKFASSAIAESADLSVFKENPSVRIYSGIFLMCLSYVIGLPALGLLSALSVYQNKPFLILIGVPLLLIASHLVFLAGVYLAGGRYLMVFLRWATRVVLEKTR
ncbi:MAG: hypothetical protein QNK29_00565 [Desulfobacterales bacterium]|nr:hypothetical protein [Desulfobacterales bacterium]MDX2510521.1 hypothetical protein [Desulfobacterales bacterium]